MSKLWMSLPELMILWIYSGSVEILVTEQRYHFAGNESRDRFHPVFDRGERLSVIVLLFGEKAQEGVTGEAGKNHPV